MGSWQLAPEQEMFLRGRRAGEPGTIDIITSFEGRFTKDVDGEAMTAAIQELVRRHEVLRLRVDRSDDAIVQTFAARPHDEVVIVAGPDGHDPPVADVWRSGPIAAVVSPARSGGHGTVRIAIHHLAYDGWSLGAIKRELSTLHRQSVAGADPGPAPRAPRYSSYLSRLGPRPPSLPIVQGRFWTGYLRGAQPYHVSPAGRPADQPLRTHPSMTPVTWSSDTTVGTAARRFGASVPVLLIGAAVLSCAVLSGDTDVTLSHIYGGRESPDAPSLIGPMGLRQLYLRQRVDFTGSVADFISGLHANWLRGIVRSIPPYSAPRLFDELSGGDRFAYLGDSASAAVGEVVVNISVGADLATPVEGDVDWVGGGGALATHPSAPLLVNAVTARFEESVRVYWRPDVLPSPQTRRFATVLGAVIRWLTQVATDARLAAVRQEVET